MILLSGKSIRMLVDPARTVASRCTDHDMITNLTRVAANPMAARCISYINEMINNSNLVVKPVKTDMTMKVKCFNGLKWEIVDPEGNESYIQDFEHPVYSYRLFAGQGTKMTPALAMVFLHWVMSQDNGGLELRFIDNDRYLALMKSLTNLIELGYLKDDPTDIDSSYWKLACPVNNEDLIYFGKADIGDLDVVRSYLNYLFEG